MVLVFVMCGYGMLDGYAADTSECTTYGGSNIGDQDYYTWSDTVKSYLVYQNGRYMRFQANAVRSGYLVEYYDKNFKLLSRRTVNKELDMFGGFASQVIIIMYSPDRPTMTNLIMLRYIVLPSMTRIGIESVPVD